MAQITASYKSNPSWKGVVRALRNKYDDNYTFLTHIDVIGWIFYGNVLELTEHDKIWNNSHTTKVNKCGAKFSKIFYDF